MGTNYTNDQDGYLCKWVIKLNTPAERHTAFLEKIIFLLKELLVLNQNVPDIIDSNDIEELNTLLDKKQSIISEIEKINNEIFANDFSQINNFPGIKALKNERFKLLSEIHKTEQKNIRLATDRQKEYEQMIKKVNKQQNIRAYTLNGEQSYFFDEKK